MATPERKRLEKIANWTGVLALGMCLLAGGYSWYAQWKRRPEAPFIQDDEPAFTENGILENTRAVAAKAIAIAPSGTIVVAGFSSGAGFFDVVLLGYRPDGKADPQFGAQGFVHIDFGGDEQINAMRISSDGKIWVAGEFANEPGEPRMGIARFLPDGRRDESFGQKGVSHFSPKGGTALARDLQLLPDGKALLSGFAEADGRRRFCVAKVLSDGKLDTDFGEKGFAELTAGTAHSETFASGVQSDAKIVLTGYAQQGEKYDFLVARLLPDGKLDRDFGERGMARGGFSTWSNYPYALVIRPTGEILVGGASGSRENYDFSLGQWTSDGIPDEKFGNNGRLTFPIGPNDDTLYALALQPNGKVLAAGSSVIPGVASAIALAKFLPDGSFDGWFGDGGRVLTAPSHYLPNALAVQKNGKILVTGNKINPAVGNVGVFVARYLPDGRLDVP